MRLRWLAHSVLCLLPFGHTLHVCVCAVSRVRCGLGSFWGRIGSNSVIQRNPTAQNCSSHPQRHPAGMRSTRPQLSRHSPPIPIDYFLISPECSCLRCPGTFSGGPCRPVSLWWNIDLSALHGRADVLPLFASSLPSCLPSLLSKA